MFQSSTLKKAVLSQSDCVQCLICGRILLKPVDRIAVFGCLLWDLTLNQNLALCLQPKMFSQAEKGRNNVVHSKKMN